MTDFTTLLQQGNAWFFIPGAILLGALHGLEPGHSKTMMAAFIVAIRGTLKQAILLGLAATLSHTVVVWVIAMAGMWFAAAGMRKPPSRGSSCFPGSSLLPSPCGCSGGPGANHAGRITMITAIITATHIITTTAITLMIIITTMSTTMARWSMPTGRMPTSAPMPRRSTVVLPASRLPLGK